LSNVQRHPASARAYASLAQAYVKSGDRTKAVKYFTEALRIDASFEHAREADSRPLLLISLRHDFLTGKDGQRDFAISMPRFMACIHERGLRKTLVRL
jgi:tetratricopeptide (TPR) repeat protein